MALDNNRIKDRRTSLSNIKQNANFFWKPVPGKQVVRIVPYKFCPDFPFIELKFHYGLAGKNYISPDSFNRPDPIVEFSNQLKKNGIKDDWKSGKALEPKMRTYVPVIVRGKESEGVKFWGFGKQVYQEILSIIDDPEYGDITDLTKGRDITVEFKDVVETGKSFPETSIRIKPNPTPAVDPTNKELVQLLGKQTDLVTLFEEKSYDELATILEQHLNPQSETVESSTNSEPSVEDEPALKSVSGTKAPTSDADTMAAFKNLFGE